MAKYKITGPDGASYVVNAPDDASEADVMAYAQKNFAGNATQDPKIPEQDPRITELQKPGAAQRMLRGVPGLGGLLDEIGAAGDAAVNYITGGASGEDYDTALARRRQAIKEDDAAHPIRNTAEALLGGAAMASGLPVAQVFTKGIPAPGMLRAGADAALNAAAYSGLSGFTEGEGGLQQRADTALDWAKTGATLGGVLGAAGSRIANSQAPTPANSPIRAADDLNMTLPRFMEGGRPAQAFAGKMGSIPFVGDDINTAVAQARGNVGNAAKTIAQTQGAGAGPVVAGEQASAAMTNWIGPKARAVQDRIYRPVEQAMKGASGPLSNTANEVQRLLNTQAEAASTRIGQTAIQEVYDAVTRPSGLTFKGAQQLRTRIGTLMDDTLNPESRVDAAALKSIYGALSKDLEGMVKAAGPKAEVAWQRANGINKQLSQRREALAKIIGAKGDATGESVVDRIVRMAGSASSADIRTLQQARAAAGAEAWRPVAGEAILRLGRNSANQFSPDIFVTKLGGLDRVGRQVLFNSLGDKDLIRKLNNLYRVSEELQKFSRLGNPSGTGGVAALLSALAGAAAGDMGTTLVTALAGRGIGRAMSGPAAVRNGGSRTMQQIISDPKFQQALSVIVSDIVSQIEEANP